MTDAYWTLAVGRDDLSRTALIEGAAPEIGAGEALLRVDRVGLTANNVTYAVLGESFRYWDFFPAEPGWGRPQCPPHRPRGDVLTRHVTAARAGRGSADASRVKAQCGRAAAGDMHVTVVEQPAQPAMVHLGFEMQRVFPGGESAAQDEISAHFHQFGSLPAGHRELFAWSIGHSFRYPGSRPRTFGRARARPWPRPWLPGLRGSWAGLAGLVAVTCLGRRPGHRPGFPRARPARPGRDRGST
jgi:hypothetical protein